MRIANIICPLLAIFVANCKNEERNVIVRTPPFFSRTYTNYNAAEANKTVNEVKAFATEHGMDFLLSTDGLQPGEFNATVAGKDLNLHAEHIDSVERGLSIFAIANHKAGPGDNELVREFRCRVASDCFEQ